MVTRELLSNDFIVNHTYFKGATDVLRDCFESYGTSSEPRCVAIVGPSGSGKTTVINSFVKECSKNTKYGFYRPVVVVQALAAPTVRTFASRILESIGDPYYAKGTEAQMTKRIHEQLKGLGTRMMVFDEMQRLVDPRPGYYRMNYKVADWLRSFIDDSKPKISTVMVGLEWIVKLFIINEQLRRCFCESYFMRGFEWCYPETRSVLLRFLKALEQKLTFAPELTICSDDMAYRFYCATAGLVGYIMGIIREAEALTYKSGGGCININHIATAYESRVCGSGVLRANPFLSTAMESIEAALKVVKPSVSELPQKITRKMNVDEKTD